MRANAPAQTSARMADVCAGRVALAATPTTAQSTKAAADHPQSAGERCRCPASHIPHAKAVAAKARGARGWAFTCKDDLLCRLLSSQPYNTLNVESLGEEINHVDLFHVIPGLQK